MKRSKNKVVWLRLRWYRKRVYELREENLTLREALEFIVTYPEAAEVIATQALTTQVTL